MIDCLIGAAYWEISISTALREWSIEWLEETEDW